jgi:hypothetical protein
VILYYADMVREANMSKKLRKGSAVRIKVLLDESGKRWPEHLRTGTVTQIGKNRARVLFPIRSFYWLPIEWLQVTGFDGDGSSVGWK